MCTTRAFIAIIIVVSVTASLSCPPGFVPQKNSCVCADWPNAIVTCDEDSRNASMQIGYCMTYDNETKEVRVGHCIQSYFRNDSYQLYYPLPAEVSELNDQMCGPSNSKGLLCGNCQNGFAISPRLTISCINCTGSHASNGRIKFVVVTYLPITIIFFVITVFAISVVSGPVNSFIFFGQVTASNYNSFCYLTSILGSQGTFMYSDRRSTVILAALYDISNLNTMRLLLPPFCVAEYLTRLPAFALDYILAFYPLILVVFLYICIKLHAGDFRPIVWCWKPFLKCFLHFRRSVDPKTSVIDAFATFIVLSYVKLLYTSGLFLLPQYLYNDQGDKLSTLVMAFSTSDQFFHKEHLPFAILSIFVVLTFIAVPPIVLTFYPASFFRKCLTRCKMNSQALCKFVETFHGSYKDGTNDTRDCRYFAGLYFILRIVVLVLSLSDIKVFLTASSLLYWLSAILFALVQPYKKRIYNVIDTLTFALMGIIYTIIVSIGVQVLITGHPSMILLIMVDVLYTLPLLYLVLFLVCWVLNRKTCCSQKLRSQKFFRCFCQDQKEMHYDNTVPHRLLHPEEYESESQSEYDALIKY